MLRLLASTAVVLLGLAASTPALSRAENVALDLNGFRLWQFSSAAEAVLGRPFQTIEREHATFQAHAAGDAYMIFEYRKKQRHNMASIQITGRRAEMIPFFGLKLGDDASAVVAALGEPDTRKQVDEPSVVQLSYEGRNYSVELDEHGKLYSIRIQVTQEIMGETSGDSVASAWSDFESAVLSGDLGRVRNRLRPDVEIYRDGKVLNIGSAYADDLQRRDAPLVSALIGEERSVRTELTKTTPEPMLRLSESLGVGHVFKFHQSDTLQEVVLFPYGGLYRVYEIRFRDVGDTAPASVAD